MEVGAEKMSCYLANGLFARTTYSKKTYPHLIRTYGTCVDLESSRLNGWMVWGQHIPWCLPLRLPLRLPCFESLALTLRYLYDLPDPHEMLW